MRLQNLCAILADSRGMAAVELALALPCILLLTLGAASVSSMVAMRNDLQQAAAQAAAMAIANPPQAGDMSTVKAVAVGASGLAADKVAVTTRMTCDGIETTDVNGCSGTQEQARYVVISLNASFAPAWRHFGLPASVPIQVSREVRYQ